MCFIYYENFVNKSRQRSNERVRWTRKINIVFDLIKSGLQVASNFITFSGNKNFIFIYFLWYRTLSHKFFFIFIYSSFFLTFFILVEIVETVKKCFLLVNTFPIHPKMWCYTTILCQSHKHTRKVLIFFFMDFYWWSQLTRKRKKIPFSYSQVFVCDSILMISNLFYL